MRDFDYVVCGNNVGAMAAALLLGKRRKVAVVNPAPVWGGIFAGVKINGAQFDAGMAFLEFSSFYSQCEDLSSYDPAVFNDSARFLNQVWEFFAQRLELTESGNLKTLLNGEFYEDIIIANQLRMISSFSAARKQKIISELTTAAREHPELHAENKKTRRELFLSANYHDVSVANHGPTLHELLISPLCRKIFNVSSQEIPALFHRAAWCPLYYPETLLAAARGESVSLPKTEFHYPKAGYFAKTAEVLAAEMLQTKGVTVLREEIVGISDENSPVLHLSGGEVTAKKIIWCGDLGRLCALSGAETKHFEMRKSSMAMAFAETEKENVAADFSTAFVCDSDQCVYRVTNQNAAHPELKTNKFIFEMNIDMLRQSGVCEDGEILAHVWDFSAKSGIFNAVPEDEGWAIRRFNGALVMPTADNYEKFLGLREVAQLRNVECVGAAAGFVAGSFNDQIVAALQLEEKYASD